MESFKQLLRRDPSTSADDQNFGPGMGPLVFTFFTLVFIGALLSVALLYMRRRRLARQQALLPRYNVHCHHRSVSMTNIPNVGTNESIFVYDEKMNLIANSSSPPSSAVPEIRVTFPDEESSGGQKQNGRVVVVHVTETGSVGMSPLVQEQLPAYQRSDAERFQSLDLDSIGGLREKEATPRRFA